MRITISKLLKWKNILKMVKNKNGRKKDGFG